MMQLCEPNSIDTKTDQSYSIGLVADTPSAMMQLRNVVDELGQRVTYALSPDQTLDSKPLNPSLWVVVSNDAADVFDALMEWSDSPVFIAEDMPKEEDGLVYQQWWSRMLTKLRNELKYAEPTTEISIERVGIVPESWKEVWVLASSLGGPEAVRVFLEHVRKDLPVAFLYAQHIEKNFDELLPTVVGKNTNLDVTFCGPSEKLRKGVVSVMPSHNQVLINHLGRVDYMLNTQWDKPYSPNINQVISNVGEHFDQRMGVIVFSGMCDDGAQSALALKDSSDIPLWAQTPEECICSAMPESVISSGKVDYIAGAKALAQKLNQRFFPNETI
ncbi:MAG: chemotaxis protein CheB [Sinobacterium sp.]|nr:chemotaxis protein CheB [Sinobacterium sp.]